MKSGIYIIKNIINDKVYVGSTNNFKARKYRHFYNLRKNKHLNNHLQSSFNKYGKGKFEFYIVIYCPVDKLQEQEVFYINYFQSSSREKGYNIEKANRTPMSQETKNKISKALMGRKGHVQTKATRDKISKGMKGKRNSLGHKRSEESKKKTSNALKGRKKGVLSIEHKIKLSIAQKGKKHSEKTKLKMSKSRKGIIFSEEHRKKLCKSQQKRRCREKLNIIN